MQSVREFAFWGARPIAAVPWRRSTVEAATAQSCTRACTVEGAPSRRGSLGAWRNRSACPQRVSGLLPDANAASAGAGPSQRLTKDCARGQLRAPAQNPDGVAGPPGRSPKPEAPCNSSRLTPRGSPQWRRDIAGLRRLVEPAPITRIPQTTEETEGSRHCSRSSSSVACVWLRRLSSSDRPQVP